MGFFISWRGQSLSRGKTITQAVNMLQRLFQSTPMLQQTEQHTQIFHKIKVKVKRNPSNLRVSADRCLLEHQQTVPRPSTAWLHAKQRNKVYPGLITFEFFFGDWARQAKVKLHHHDCVALHLHRTEHSHKSRLSAAMTLPPPHNEQILSKVP